MIAAASAHTLGPGWAALDGVACLIVSCMALLSLRVQAFDDNFGQRLGLFGVALYSLLHGFSALDTRATTFEALALSLGLLSFAAGLTAKLLYSATLSARIEAQEAELRVLTSQRMDLDDRPHHHQAAAAPPQRMRA